MRIHAVVPVLALAVLIGIGSAGCSKQLQHTTLQNQMPTVTLTWAPIDTKSKVFYIYKMNWVGYDPDGRVAYFQYLVDPPTAEGVDIWAGAKRTEKNEEQITFQSTKPEDGFQDQAVPRTEDPHVFMIRAVDNLGKASEPVARAFYSFGVAPTVQILNPTPQKLLVPKVTPAVRVSWTGKDFTDQNGISFEKPLFQGKGYRDDPDYKKYGYKYHIYKRFNPGVHWDDWLQDPDSLRREVAPDFVGWDSIGPETPEVQFTNLTTGSDYLFVVVAFSRSGAYSPIFALQGLNANMLRMRVELAGVFGPTITLFNSFFQYSYKTGGYLLDPSRAILLQVPAGAPLRFNWFAVPDPGSIMRRYRWVLDLVALDDETPRTNQNDWYHWSPWGGPEFTSATIGPFVGSEGDTGEIHNFYLEAEDINGLVSLGWVQFRVYRPTFDRDILVVNDTRFQVDEIAETQPPGRTDSLRAPYGVWPSRAELDTFLFAVGGKPWRMKTGSRLSRAGIFSGYSFDTLGTRYGQTIPTIALGLLGHYQYVVWMADKAAGYDLAPNSQTLPMPTLLYMSDRDRQNTLATWVSQGGKLWALGGGFATATNKLWNSTRNDDNQIRTYSSLSTPPDLTAGRFMYDLVHWRSEFRTYGPVFVRVSRYDQADPTVIGYPRPPNYWKGFQPWTPTNSDYLSLPTTLQFRSPTSDPRSLWPDRRSDTEYFIGNKAYSSIGVDIEFMSKENRILEEVPAPTESNPDATAEISTLDTLYMLYSTAYPKQLNQSDKGEGVNVMMTYYHGRENANDAWMVFTGMAIWDFRRQDCQSLVDFVLQKLWHLNKNTFYTTSPSAVTPSFARRTAVPTPQPPQVTPGLVRRVAGLSTSKRWR
jgi:hypothetical protein